MSPPTQVWAKAASGSRDLFGKAAVPAMILLPASVDLSRGTDLVAQLGQALLGVRVPAVRLPQLGGVGRDRPHGRQVQGADQLDRGLQALVDRGVSAVRA